jgi:8-oxoguanine deaminase
VVENEDAILKDTQRLIEQHHRTEHGSMVNVAVAPCSPFSVSRDLMRRQCRAGPRTRHPPAHPPGRKRPRSGVQPRQVQLHPRQYAQDLGWLGHDVWHAHCVKLDDEGISLFAATAPAWPTARAATCGWPAASCPVRKMLNAGVPVGLGVDGSASNDAAHMVNEARQALLLARVGRALQPPETRTDPSTGERRTFFGCDLGPAEMTARDALHIATRGGAQVLGRAQRHRPHCPRHVRRCGAVGPAHTGFCW